MPHTSTVKQQSMLPWNTVTPQVGLQLAVVKAVLGGLASRRGGSQISSLVPPRVPKVTNHCLHITATWYTHVFSGNIPVCATLQFLLPCSELKAQSSRNASGFPTGSIGNVALSELEAVQGTSLAGTILCKVIRWSLLSRITVQFDGWEPNGYNEKCEHQICPVGSCSFSKWALSNSVNGGQVSNLFNGIILIH